MNETGQTVLPSDFSEGDLFTAGDADQQRAIKVALNNRFAVISGGPGTGKTFTIAQIILCLQRLGAGKNLQIKLAAPTGKAAARLQQALDQAFETMRKTGREIPADVCPAQTIHRLLGAVPGKTRFLFNDRKQIPADVVIVDEASMIDLALMAKLIQAVPVSARLILVGDKDQLASVEAGAVLGDICAGLQWDHTREKDTGTKKPSNVVRTNKMVDLGAHIVVLKKNYRFDANSGIDALGSAVNAGDVERTLDLLQNESNRDIELKPFNTSKDMQAALERLVAEKIAPAFTMREAQDALRQLNTLKILTALRKGPVGVQALNQWVEQILVRHDVIESYQGSSPEWYSGRPVMITCNDYYRNLFNGDMGIAMRNAPSRSAALQVIFPASKQGVKFMVPEQLPAHETVYAMTVHKSQGTEFDQVVLVMPDMDVPLLTRELLYTAITRARRRVEIWGRWDILKKAIPRRIRRASGLTQALWP
jgi:exodeoxyribonuclease V alpha subunit